MKSYCPEVESVENSGGSEEKKCGCKLCLLPEKTKWKHVRL
jgi:hypothetical protein